MEAKSLFKLVGAFFAGILLLTGLLGAFYTVDSGERALVLRYGKVVDVVGDGLHAKIPFVESVTKVSVRTFKAEAQAVASTKDIQTAHTTVAVNYHLNPDALKDIYSKTGFNMNASIIDPRIQEVVKAVTAKYSAEELLKKREEVKNAITSELRDALAQYNVIAEGTQITNFSFSEGFTEAVEAKQVAEQLAAKARNDLERIKVEGEQKVATAKAEAESIRVQSEAVRAQGGKEYVQLKAIEKWDGTLPSTIAGGGADFLINLK